MNRSKACYHVAKSICVIIISFQSLRNYMKCTFNCGENSISSWVHIIHSPHNTHRCSHASHRNGQPHSHASSLSQPQPSFTQVCGHVQSQTAVPRPVTVTVTGTARPHHLGCSLGLHQLPRSTPAPALKGPFPGSARCTQSHS